MARQAGPFFFTGTIDDVTFYKMGDRYYMRRKSEPTNRRKHKQGGTPLQRLKKKQFGEASVLVSEVYRKLPKAKRRHLLHQELTGRAVRMLRMGMTEEAIAKTLLDELLPAQKEAVVLYVPKKTTKAAIKKAPKAQGFSLWQVTNEGGLQKGSVLPVVNASEQCCGTCVCMGLLRGKEKSDSG